MLEPYAGEHDRHRRRDGVARLHLQRADGLPARAPASSRFASWASCRPRRSPSSTPSSTARTRSRSTATRSRPASASSSWTTCWRPAARSTGTIELVERLQGRGRRPRLPRRARLPQGSRPARRTPRHERHQVLTDPIRSEIRDWPTRPTRPRRRRRSRPRHGHGAEAAEPAPAARHGPPAVLPGSSPARSSRPPRPWPAPPRRSSRLRPRRPAPSSNPDGAVAQLGAAADAAVAPPAGPSGFRTPFREDGGVLYLIDQRRLPDALVEYPCRSAGEVAYAIREMVVRGAPAIGQVAAIGLAMSAENQRDGRPYARQATLRGSANALINARPTAVNLRWAVDRVMARYDGARRAVRGRRRHRRRDAGRGRRDRLRGHHRPRPAGGLRARGPARPRRPARSGS